MSGSLPEVLRITGSGVTPGASRVSPESRNITIRLSQRLETHNLRLQLGSGELQRIKELPAERIRVPGRGSR